MQQLLAAVVSVLLIAGCSAPSAAGFWYSENQPNTVRLELRGDGQAVVGLRMETWVKGIPDWSQTIIGRWKQEGNTVITSPSGNRWKIEDGILIATNSKGEPLRYIRKNS